MAIQDYSESLKYLPEDSKDKDKIYNYRGNAYREIQDYENAITDYSAAIRINPNRHIYFTNRAYLHGILNNTLNEVKDYTQSIKLNPNNALAFNNRGVAYRKLGDFEKSIEDYNEALRLNPDFMEALNNRGFTHRLIENYSEAKKDFEKVVQIDPSFTSAHENLKSMKYVGIKQVIGKINGLFKPATKND